MDCMLPPDPASGLAKSAVSAGTEGACTHLSDRGENNYETDNHPGNLEKQ